MSNYITYTVKYGDTLQRIAMKYNLNDWMTLAIQNNLKYPFIVDNSQDKISNPNTITTGDVIIIPISVDIITNQELYDTYGKDIALVSYTMNLEAPGDIIGDGSGDILVVSDIDTIRQGIIHKFMTELGELPMHPEYGTTVLSLVGSKKLPRNLIKLKLEVESVIKSDYRVKGVENLLVTSIQGGVEVSCKIIPIDPYSDFPFNYTIEG